MTDNTIASREDIRNFVYGKTSQFDLKVAGQVLHCTQILRLLPGKRLVAYGEWQGQAVVAKIFVSGKAARHVAREVLGNKLLTDNDIVSPKIVFHGASDIAGVELILFERLRVVQDVDEIWLAEDKNELLDLLKRMQTCLVKAHQAGLLQQDLHPHNFLLAGKKLYVIDTAELRPYENLSQSQILKNLAKLYAQLPVRQQPLVQEAFADYCEKSSWQFSEVLLASLFREFYRFREKRVLAAKKRAMRNASRFVFERGFFHVFAADRGAFHAYIQDFFEMPEEYLVSAISQPIKKGNTCSVFSLEFPRETYVVKRYNIKNTWHFLKRCWRMSRARRSWLNAQVLRILNIPTAKPIAFLEERIFCHLLHAHTYFVSRQLNGLLLGDYLAQKPEEVEHADVVRQACVILKCLYDAGITHGDLKATNFIVHGGKLSLLDLDAMRMRRKNARFERLFRKDLARFMRNWEDQPELYQVFAGELQGFDFNV